MKNAAPSTGLTAVFTHEKTAANSTETAEKRLINLINHILSNTPPRPNANRAPSTDEPPASYR